MGHFASVLLRASSTKLLVTPFSRNDLPSSFGRSFIARRHMGKCSRSSGGWVRRAMVMNAHWKFYVVLFLMVGLLAGFASAAAATTSSDKAKTVSGAKPSQSDILTCDDFNTDFAQLAAESPFV